MELCQGFRQAGTVPAKAGMEPLGTPASTMGGLKYVLQKAGMARTPGGTPGMKLCILKTAEHLKLYCSK